MKTIDITGKIGPLGSDCEWPMYSYNRAAYTLWNGIANGLKARRWTEKQIRDWLQSKSPRWALDGELGVSLEKLGMEFAKSCEKVKP